MNLLRSPENDERSHCSESGRSAFAVNSAFIQILCQTINLYEFHLKQEVKMLKKVILVSSVGLFMLGCSGKVSLPLEEVTSKSYSITKDMNQSTVSEIIPMKPTSVQRIDGEEIWKYEGDVSDPKTKTRTYHNLTVKFVDGKVKNIGTFSCKLPGGLEE